MKTETMARYKLILAEMEKREPWTSHIAAQAFRELLWAANYHNVSDETLEMARDSFCILCGTVDHDLRWGACGECNTEKLQEAHEKAVSHAKSPDYYVEVVDLTSRSIETHGPMSTGEAEKYADMMRSRINTCYVRIRREGE